MIPVGTRLIDLRNVSNPGIYRWVVSKANTYGEVVGERTSRWDGTLRNPCRAIHLGGAILKESMEMERCALVSQLIVHVDDKPVAH